MQRLLFSATLFSLSLLLCCNSSQEETSNKKQKIVIRFELDTAGNIMNAEVKKQLAELAINISANADKVMMYSYTEKMNSPEESIAIATEQANAAKMWMYQSAKERIFYNVGIEAKGFEKPVDITNPTSRINRRIEIEYL